VPVAFIKRVIDRAAPLASFSERADLAGNSGGGSSKGKTDAEIDADAKAYAAKHNVAYAEALNRVVAFTA